MLPAVKDYGKGNPRTGIPPAVRKIVAGCPDLWGDWLAMLDAIADPDFEPTVEEMAPVLSAFKRLRSAGVPFSGAVCRAVEGMENSALFTDDDADHDGQDELIGWEDSDEDYDGLIQAGYVEQDEYAWLRSHVLSLTLSSYGRNRGDLALAVRRNQLRRREADHG